MVSFNSTFIVPMIAGLFFVVILLYFFFRMAERGSENIIGGIQKIAHKINALKKEKQQLDKAESKTAGTLLDLVVQLKEHLETLQQEEQQQNMHNSGEMIQNADQMMRTLTEFINKPHALRQETKMFDTLLASWNQVSESIKQLNPQQNNSPSNQSIATIKGIAVQINEHITALRHELEQERVILQEEAKEVEKEKKATIELNQQDEDKLQAEQG